MNHAALHVVLAALGDTLDQGALRQLKVDKMDVDGRRPVGGDAHDIAVLPLQGGTGDNDAVGRAGGAAVVFGGGQGLDGGFAQGNQPVPAVFVAEGDAVGHLILAGLRMELSAEKTLVRTIPHGGAEEDGTSSPSRNGRFNSRWRPRQMVLFPEPAGPVMIQMCWLGASGSLLICHIEEDEDEDAAVVIEGPLGAPLMVGCGRSSADSIVGRRYGMEIWV